MPQTIVVPEGAQIYLAAVIFSASKADCGARESCVMRKRFDGRSLAGLSACQTSVWRTGTLPLNKQAKRAGVPYQRFIRMAIEHALQQGPR